MTNHKRGALPRKRPKTAPAPPFGYRAGNSPLHRCPAPLKLLAVLLLSIFAYGSVPGLCAGALGLAAAAVIAGIRPWELLRGSRPVMSLALLFFVIRITEFGGPAPFFHIDKAEIPGGLVQGLSMLVSFTGGALLFAVTTMGELRMGLRAGRLTPLLSRFGLALSLMLGFFPRFFEIWENTTLAWRARGGSPWKIGRLILPVTERMLEAAFDTAEALEARGWN